MTETQPGGRAIDDVADRFEDAWRVGPRPRIEDYLGGDPANDRAALLEELVCVDVHRRRAAGEAPLLAEYQARFPDDPSAVEAGFLAAEAPGPARETDPAFEPVGAQILLGILALQHGFVDRDSLLSAFEAWTGDKTRGLGEILVERGDLTAARLALLETLAAQTLKQYDGDLNKGLASRGAIDTIRDALARLHDAEIDATLTLLPGLSTTVTDRGASARRADRLASLRFPNDRFRLIRRINGGGQGDIYLALDESLNRTVALKRIKKRYAYSPEFQARLLVEAEVAARLEHPAFLPVHFAGFDANGWPYFVMRYVEGDSTLKSRIEEFHAAAGAARSADERAQSLRKLLRHFVDVCYAVAYAHGRGVIHRDIKPANVLVGQFGETYLVDWGMVKFTGRPAGPEDHPDELLLPAPDLDPAYSVAGGGTLPYMSPEQVARRPSDFATDVYSLGVMLYVLLTGRHAFVGGDRDEIKANILQGRFKHPRAVAGRVPAALEAVCLKAMKLRPQDRYATAKEMARDIEDWLADRPIAVYREPWPLRARRWARNHRPVVAGLAVLLVTSVLSLIVAHSLLRREQARTETNFRAVLRLVRLSRFPSRSKQVRDELERTAIESTRAFLNTRPHDRGARLDMAQTYRDAANMRRMVGELETPRDLYRQGADLLRALHAEFANDPDIAEERALNSIDTGELWLLNGQPAKAKHLFEGVLHELDASGGNLTPSQQRVKAMALVDVATALNDMDDPARARDSARLAAKLLAPLGDALHHPDEALWALLAQSQAGLAENELGNPGGAEESFALAIGRGRALIEAGHDNPQVKHALAQALGQHALAYLLSPRARGGAADPKRWEESTGEFVEAALLLQSLVGEHPHVLHYHRDLAISCIGWADILIARGVIDGLKEKNNLTEKNNTDAEEELGLYAGSRELFDYHRQLGRVLAQRARIEMAKGNREAARSLFGRAIDQHTKALEANPDSRIDRLLRDRISKELDILH
jgi:serine/threonine protein kinase